MKTKLKITTTRSSSNNKSNTKYKKQNKQDIEFKYKLKKRSCVLDIKPTNTNNELIKKNNSLINKHENQIFLNDKSATNDIMFSYKKFRAYLCSSTADSIKEEISDIKKLILLSKKLRGDYLGKNKDKDGNANLKYVTLKDKEKNVLTNFLMPNLGTLRLSDRDNRLKIFTKDGKDAKEGDNLTHILSKKAASNAMDEIIYSQNNNSISNKDCIALNLKDKIIISTNKKLNNFTST